MRSVGWLVLGGLGCAVVGLLAGRCVGPTHDPVATSREPNGPTTPRSWPTTWPDGGPPIGPDLEALLEDPGANWDVERLIEYLGIGYSRRGLLGGDLDGWGGPYRVPPPGPLRVFPQWPTPFATWFAQGRTHELVAGRWVPRRDAAWTTLDPGAR